MINSVIRNDNRVRFHSEESRASENIDPIVKALRKAKDSLMKTSISLSNSSKKEDARLNLNILHAVTKLDESISLLER